MRRIANGIDVARTNALLDIRQARSSRMLHRAHEIRHKRMHARRREEHGRVVLGNHRSAGNDLVPLRLEELEIEIAEFIRRNVSLGHLVSLTILNLLSLYLLKPFAVRNSHARSIHV